MAEVEKGMAAVAAVVRTIEEDILSRESMPPKIGSIDEDGNRRWNLRHEIGRYEDLEREEKSLEQELKEVRGPGSKLVPRR